MKNSGRKLKTISEKRQLSSLQKVIFNRLHAALDFDAKGDEAIKSLIESYLSARVSAFPFSYGPEFVDEAIAKLQAEILADGAYSAKPKAKKEFRHAFSPGFQLLVTIVSFILFFASVVLTIIFDSLASLLFSVLFLAVGIAFMAARLDAAHRLSVDDNESLPKAMMILILSAITLGLLFVFYYTFLPTLSLQSGDFIWFVLISAILLFLVFDYLLYRYHLCKRPSSKRRKRPFLRLCLLSTGILVAIASLFSLGGVLSSSALFRAKDLATLLPLFSVSDRVQVEDDFALEDNEILLPSVDLELSYRQAEIALGDYGNQYYINQKHFSIQSLKSEKDAKARLVRVSPLEYSNVFVSLQNNTRGTPGYIMVDVTTGEVELKTEKRLVYTESAKLSTDLKRHFRTNNLGKMCDNFYFEIDDEYQPYWVFPCYERRVGLFGGKVPSAVVTMDATSGEMACYDLEAAPSWIDNVVDRQIVESLAVDALRYQRGYINATLGSKEGVYRINDGYNYFVKDGMPYYVASVTSSDSRDHTAVGFIVIGLRAGDATFYRANGITEGRAMSIAELDDSIKAIGLKATWPVFVYAGGTPAYFFTLKNDVKVQKYVFLDQQTGERLSIGDSLEEAYQQYLVLLGASSTLTRITGAVERVRVYEDCLYFSLEGQDRVYAADLSLDPHLLLVQSGDAISFTAYSQAGELGYYEVTAISSLG